MAENLGDAVFYPSGNQHEKGKLDGRDIPNRWTLYRQSVQSPKWHLALPITHFFRLQPAIFSNVFLLGSSSRAWIEFDCPPPQPSLKHLGFSLGIISECLLNHSNSFCPRFNQIWCMFAMNATLFKKTKAKSVTSHYQLSNSTEEYLFKLLH